MHMDTPPVHSACLLMPFPCTSAQASDDDGTKFLCSKAELIDELESSIPSFMRGNNWYVFG